MRLLLDQNLSPRLATRLADLFPGTSHVSLHSLDQTSDEEVWEFARTHGLTLVTKDSDFSDIGVLRGFPPKVIWLRLGNCTTAQVEHLIRRHHPDIMQFEGDSDTGLLALL